MDLDLDLGLVVSLAALGASRSPDRSGDRLTNRSRDGLHASPELLWRRLRLTGMQG